MPETVAGGGGGEIMSKLEENQFQKLLFNSRILNTSDDSNHFYTVSKAWLYLAL